jgi:hypothetical protein
MYFDILTALHVFSAHEYDKVVYECRLSVCLPTTLYFMYVHVYTYVCMCTSLVPEPFDGFYSYSI